MLIWSTALTFSSEKSGIYFSALWRFSNLVAILMSSPWAPSCPIFNKGVIWTSGLGFYTSTKCSSDKCCLFFFSTKVFVLNYATEGKMLYGASCEIFVKRHLGNIKTKQNKQFGQSKRITIFMTLYYYKLYWRRNFQLTLRQKCMNIQHGYYSHSFMKFPENFKISQIGSSDDLQPPLQPFFPPKYLLIWFQWVSYKADEYIVPWHNMENALIFLETYHLHLLIFMKLYLNNPVHLLSAFSTLQFNLGFDRWKKSHYVDMLLTVHTTKTKSYFLFYENQFIYISCL